MSKKNLIPLPSPKMIFARSVYSKFVFPCATFLPFFPLCFYFLYLLPCFLLIFNLTCIFKLPPCLFALYLSSPLPHVIGLWFWGGAVFRTECRYAPPPPLGDSLVRAPFQALSKDLMSFYGPVALTVKKKELYFYEAFLFFCFAFSRAPKSIIYLLKGTVSRDFRILILILLRPLIHTLDYFRKQWLIRRIFNF